MARIHKEEIDRLFDYGIYVPTRTIYMGSVVSEEGEDQGVNAYMAETVIKGLHILDSAAPNGDKEITIIMNNPGGDEYDGIAIYDAIKACVNPVKVITYGHAMSMGGIILQAADLRVMSPNSRFMMHYGDFNTTGNAKDVYAWIEDNKKIDTWMEDVFLEKMKEKDPSMDRKKLQEMLKADFIINAYEAVKMGLADEVLGD